MKKRTVVTVLLIVAGVFCLLLPFLLLLFLMNGGQETVGIIGGADMPTLWFLLGRLGLLPYLLWGCAIVLFAVAAVCGVRSKR